MKKSNFSNWLIRLVSVFSFFLWLSSAALWADDFSEDFPEDFPDETSEAAASQKVANTGAAPETLDKADHTFLRNRVDGMERDLTQIQEKIRSLEDRIRNLDRQVDDIDRRHH